MVKKIKLLSRVKEVTKYTTTFLLAIAAILESDRLFASLKYIKRILLMRLPLPLWLIFAMIILISVLVIWLIQSYRQTSRLQNVSESQKRSQSSRPFAGWLHR